MKYCLIFLLCLLVVTKAQVMQGMPAEVLNKMQASIVKCVLKTGVNPNEIQNIFGPSIPEGKGACFMACVMKNNNAMQADNRINIEVIKTLLTPMKGNNALQYDSMVKLFSKCQVPTPDVDECTAARDFKVCLVSNAKEMQLI